ncbi:ISAs1 family transposase, partial [Agathobacter ruminis]
RSPAKGSKNNLALIRKFAYNILRIMRIQHSVKESLPEVMDLFADSLELLHKYIFEGITPIN